MLGGSNVAVIGQSALFKQTKLDPDASSRRAVVTLHLLR
jgi:hypothetical protein